MGYGTKKIVIVSSVYRNVQCPRHIYVKAKAASKSSKNASAWFQNYFDKGVIESTLIMHYDMVKENGSKHYLL